MLRIAKSRLLRQKLGVQAPTSGTGCMPVPLPLRLTPAHFSQKVLGLRPNTFLRDTRSYNFLTRCRMAAGFWFAALSVNQKPHSRQRVALLRKRACRNNVTRSACCSPFSSAFARQRSLFRRGCAAPYKSLSLRHIAKTACFINILGKTGGFLMRSILYFAWFWCILLLKLLPR